MYVSLTAASQSIGVLRHGKRKGRNTLDNKGTTRKLRQLTTHMVVTIKAPKMEAPASRNAGLRYKLRGTAAITTPK